MHPDTADLALAAAEPAALPPGEPPEWVHLLPAGTVRGVDGRGPYTLADAAAVIAASRERAVVTAGDIPIDYDHAMDLAAPQGLPAKAAGWIKELQARADGVWGRVEWTPQARQHIADREYRFLSPVFRHLRDAGGTIKAVVHAALTNSPNLVLTALAAQDRSQDHRMDKTLGDLAVALGLAETTPADQLATQARQTVTALAAAKDTLGKIRAALKLPADAAPDAVVAAVAAAVDPAKTVPADQVMALQSQLTDLRAERAREKAEAVVAAAMAAGKVVPALREWALALAAQAPAAFAAFVAAQPAVLTPGSVMPGGTPPAGGDGMTADETALCSQLGLDPAAYRKTRDAERAAR